MKLINLEVLCIQYETNASLVAQKLTIDCLYLFAILIFELLVHVVYTARENEGELNRQVIRRYNVGKVHYYLIIRSCNLDAGTRKTPP